MFSRALPHIIIRGLIVWGLLLSTVALAQEPWATLSQGDGVSLNEGEAQRFGEAAPAAGGLPPYSEAKFT